MLKCTLSVTRYKGPCFAQFGEAAVSKALSVKNAHLLVYVIFCVQICVLFMGGEGGRGIGKPSMKWKKYDSDGE